MNSRSRLTERIGESRRFIWKPKLDELVVENCILIFFLCFFFFQDETICFCFVLNLFGYSNIERYHYIVWGDENITICLLWTCAWLTHTILIWHTNTIQNRINWFEWNICIISEYVCACYCEWCTDVRKFKVVEALEIGLDSGVFRRSRKIICGRYILFENCRGFSRCKKHKCLTLM